jgi:RecA-family ATPase
MGAAVPLSLPSAVSNDTAPTWPFLDLSKWIDQRPPERHFLVPGLVPGGCVTSLYGDGGSGKTLIALWLMVAMASRYRVNWLGGQALGFKSVGLFSEDDADELVRRLHRICDGCDVDFASVAPHITALPGVGMDTVIAYFADTGELVMTPIMEALLAKVRETGSSLLVLDYAAAIFGGNEIDRFQVSTFMRRLNAIAKENDIAILLLGHPSVDGMKGGRGTSGSTAWRNQSRSFLHLTVDEEQDDTEGRRLLTLSLTKANYAPTGRTWKLASDGGRFDILETAAITTQKPRGPRLTAAQKVCLDALGMALDHVGEPVRVTPAHIEKRCVSVDVWRTHAYSMGVTDSEDQPSRRRAFFDTRKALIAKGLVGSDEPWAWLA